MIIAFLPNPLMSVNFRALKNKIHQGSGSFFEAVFPAFRFCVAASNERAHGLSGRRFGTQLPEASRRATSGEEGRGSDDVR